MRFRGGGVGHQATNTFTTCFRQDAQAFAEDETTCEAEEVHDDWEEARIMEEEDYGYVVENEDEEDADEEDMGAEDGEEPWEIRDLEAEGYDEL